MSGRTIIEVKIHDKESHKWVYHFQLRITSKKAKTDSAKCPETDEKKRMYCWGKFPS